MNRFRQILKRLAKVLAIVLVLLSLMLLVVWFWVGGDKTSPDKISWGLTFSSKQARALELDPAATYSQILNELKPKRLRLVAYWDEIEIEDDKFDFDELDSQVKLAEDKGIPYMILVGHRVARYPECFAPDWYKGLEKSRQGASLLDYVRRVIGRYDQGHHLVAWQVENEPYLSSFGKCPAVDEDLLAEEIDVARRASRHKIITSDSGEISTWFKASRYPDIFGTTMYRVVINENSGKVFRHFLPPFAYTRRANLIKKLRANIQQIIVLELQAEPWSQKPLVERDKVHFDMTMDHQQFKKNIEFATEAGLPEVYLWGAEWWLFEKNHGDDFFWNESKSLFDRSPA